MKTETRYICEICGNWSREAETALACEARGVDPGPPIGLLFSEEKGDFYGPDFAFAVAESVVSNHSRIVAFWACRDDGAGDSLDHLCGNGTGLRIHAGMTFKKKWLERPAMKRLIAWMRSKKIEPKVLCADGKIAPLNRTNAEAR